MQKEMEKQEMPAETTVQKQERSQENIWSATLRTMRIVLFQYRIGLYSMILLSVIIVPLWNLLQAYIEVSGHRYVVVPWCIYICGGIKILLAIIAVFMAASSYNILSRDEISMYPGNVISRYSGTVLAFHFMIVVSVLASIVGYLLQGMLLAVASHLWGDSAVLGNAFCLSYLCYGSIRYLGLLLAIYAIGVFWFVLTERFHLILCYFSLMALVVVLVVLAVRGRIRGKLQILIDFLKGQGFSYTALIAVLFGVWVILMALSFCLAATVKVWKASDKKRLGLAVALGYFVIFGGLWIYLTGEREGYSYSMDPTIFQKESHQQVEVVADVSAWEEKDTSLLSGYRMAVKYPEKQNSSDYQSEVFASICCSASEAKSYGLSFDESKLDQDHVILLLGTRNFTFAGKDLGEDALQAYQQSCKLVSYGGPAEWYLEYLEEHPEDKPEEEYEPDYHYETEVSGSPMTLLNGMYGNLSMYMDDMTLYEEGDYWEDHTNAIGAMLRIVIYPDEWDREMVQE